jgi:outer membrane protein OmpA-like peptidoglycan-associated protein
MAAADTMKLIITDLRTISSGWRQPHCRRTLLLMALAMAMASFTWIRPAFSDTDHARDKGFYIGAGTGLGYLNPKDDRAEITVKEQKDLAGQIFLGLDLGHRFGAELQYSHLGTADLTDNASLRYRETSVSGLMYGFNTKANRQMRRGLYGFGRAGIGKLFTTAQSVEHKQENDYHLLLGVGAEYGFSNRFAVRGEYLSYDHDAKYLQVALLYRLSKPERTSVSKEPLPEPSPVPIIPIESDRDGVPDTTDLCPDTPQGVTVDQDGCPIYIDAIQGVNFVSNSADLMPQAQDILDAAAESLLLFTNISVRIMAHTDDRGRAEYNLDLSRRRALSVAGYLQAKGIDLSRLLPQGFGESDPIAANDTAEGRYQNRRVEFETFSRP